MFPLWIHWIPEVENTTSQCSHLQPLHLHPGYLWWTMTCMHLFPSDTEGTCWNHERRLKKAECPADIILTIMDWKDFELSSKRQKQKQKCSSFFFNGWSTLSLVLYSFGDLSFFYVQWEIPSATTATTSRMLLKARVWLYHFQNCSADGSTSGNSCPMQ